MDDGDAALDDCDWCCWEVVEGDEGLALAPAPEAMLVADVDAPAASDGEGAAPVNDWDEHFCWVLDADDG